MENLGPIFRHPELAKDPARSGSELSGPCRYTPDPSGLKSLRMTPVEGIAQPGSEVRSGMTPSGEFWVGLAACRCARRCDLILWASVQQIYQRLI